METRSGKRKREEKEANECGNYKCKNTLDGYEGEAFTRVMVLWQTVTPEDDPPIFESRNTPLHFKLCETCVTKFKDGTYKEPYYMIVFLFKDDKIIPKASTSEIKYTCERCKGNMNDLMGNVKYKVTFETCVRESKKDENPKEYTEIMDFNYMCSDCFKLAHREKYIMIKILKSGREKRTTEEGAITFAYNLTFI